jgi:Xaa-Pro aminopeptidase
MNANTDAEKPAAKLTLNMARALAWWCRNGMISADVDDSTRRALVRRGLGTWAGGGSVALTPAGLEAQITAMAAIGDQQRGHRDARQHGL